MKIYEYFSLGIPVVSTPIKGAPSEYMYVGKSADEIISLIKKALTEKKQKEKELKKIARSASWKRYVQEIEKALKLHNSAIR